MDGYPKCDLEETPFAASWTHPRRLGRSSPRRRRRRGQRRGWYCCK